MNELYAVDVGDGLEHYGRLGMKWGQHIFTTGKNAVSSARSNASRRSAERRERKKQSIIDSGDTKKILRHKRMLTTGELEKAYEKAAVVTKIKDLDAVKSKNSKAKKAVAAISTGVGLITSIQTLINVGKNFSKTIDELAND